MPRTVPRLMQKKLSRRELTRQLELFAGRAEQGRAAMRVLAALVVDRGGMVRVPRDVFDGLPRDHRLEVERERLTGDLIVRAKGPAGQVEELTFEQIRERYGKKNTEGEVDRPSDDLDDEKAAQQGSEDSEPPNSSVGIPE